MRRVLVLIGAGILTCGLSPVASTAAAATVQCSYTPILPSISVGKLTVSRHLKLRVVSADGAHCRAYFRAFTDISHGTDVYPVTWDHSDPKAYLNVDSRTLRPGRYVTKDNDCYAYGSSGTPTYSCTLHNAHMIVKFAGRARLSIKREADGRVRYTVKTRRYANRAAYIGQRDTAVLERWHAGAWRSVHTFHTSTKGIDSWTSRTIKSGTFRVQAAGTAKSWPATSPKVKK